MATKIPDDMPCKADCPDRKPGCFCEKKKSWNEKRYAEKQAIRNIKAKENLTFSVRQPKRKGDRR